MAHHVPEAEHMGLGSRTEVGMATDNTGLLYKLLSSTPVIQDPAGLKTLISIQERAAYSFCFYI